MLKVALIGLGTHMLRGHYLALKENPDAEIVCGFDPSKEIHPDFKINRVADETEIFNNIDVDAMIVSSPDKYHITALEKAVQHIETPLVKTVGILGSTEQYFVPLPMGVPRPCLKYSVLHSDRDLARARNHTSARDPLKSF
jgi:hypothetical protein